MSQEFIKILGQMEKYIKYGNINDLKNIIKQLQENEGDLKNVTDNANSCPDIPNLVILACRNNKVEILKYLLANDGEVLRQINGTKNIPLPDDIDTFHHNAFYYAIRSGNIELLNTLITDWQGPLLSLNNSEMLDDILSKAYEEIKLKNILIPDEMQICVESQLIDINFLSNKTVIPNKKASRSPLDNIKERINFLIEIIALLTEEFAANENEINERFFFLAKCIAQNIYVLKRQLKATYTILPWEEIEFCLICFISSHKTKHEMNIFYHSTLSKTKLLNYLNLFAEKLHEVETIHLRNIETRKIAELPNLSRDDVVANILRVCPQFEELYDDHKQIRDIHSLTKMSEYIKLSMDVDPKQREGQLVITRTLQIIGEYFKNTLESPKLSKTTNTLLLFSLSNTTKKIITGLRNSLTHAFSLFQRTKIEQNNDVNFFEGIQQDCKKLGGLIADIRHKKKIYFISVLLNEILNSNDAERIIEMSKTLSDCFNLEDIEVGSFRSQNHEKIETLYAKLRSSITLPTNYETEMFQKLDDLIKFEKIDNAESRELYIAACSVFKIIHVCVENKDFVIVKGIKNLVKTILDSITTNHEDEFKYKSIAYVSLLIFNSCESRMQNDEQKVKDIYTLVIDIQFIAFFGTNDVKFIKELDQKINDQFSAIKKEDQTTNFSSTNEKYKDELKRKLHELRHELEKNFDSKPIITEIYPSYKCNKKLQAIVELLLLDILTILGVSKTCFLENNFLSFNENSPMLTGKSLRNHLAHNNVLVDLLLTDPSISIVLNANKLITENIITDKKRIGKTFREDLAKIKNNYKWGLMIIDNQNRMLMALQNGNIDDFLCCLESGTDIFAKCCRMRTTLHYAAIGGNLEIVEYLYNENVPADARDAYSKTALHVAAEYGRTNVVEYLLSKQLNSVDQQTKLNETSLHLAAGKGHKDTVECLLKHNASTNKQNTFDLVPLQKAVLHGHKNIIEVLLRKRRNVEVVNSLALLHLASKSGSLEVVSYLLEKGAKVNANSDTSDGKTPLHLAAQYGHLTIVNVLIENKARVNATDKDGCAALHLAAENGHDEIFSVLLKHGADINVVDVDKYTPLHYAVKNKQEKIVDICLTAGANPDLRTSAGRSALHYAIISINLNIIKTLLRRGVETNCKDQKGFTPLHLAGFELSSTKEIVELLLKNGAKINARDNSNCTPLHLASMTGNIAVIESLVTNGADINALQKNNKTPLHIAAVNKKFDAIKILVNNKALVNTKDKNGITPLFLAASNGSCDIVEYLLQNKAKENKNKYSNFISINAAITFGQVEVVKVLLQHRSQINDEGMKHGTNLYLAVASGNINIVKILIENGADVDPKGMGDQSPLCCAIHLNRKEIVKLLVSNGANVDGEVGEPMYTAIFDGHYDIVEYLLNKKARIITKLLGKYVLHLAVSRGHKEIVSALIRYGADVNGADVNNPDKNKTFAPLHLAVVLNKNEIIKILLENGANINQNSIDGTPLHVAVLQNNLECVKMMVKSGKANINMKASSTDHTILHVAAENGYLEMVKYFIDNGSDIDARTSSHGSKAIHIAANEGFTNIVEFLHKTGLSVDDTNLLNQTPLHCCAKNGRLEVAKYLIAQNACINSQDFLGSTPLHCAANNGHTNIVELLLQNGAIHNAMDVINNIALKHSSTTEINRLLTSTANLFEAVKENNCSSVERSLKMGAIINSLNNKGFTPLCLASRKGFVDVVRILLKNKANPNAVDLNRFTSLHYALELSHFDIVKLLLVNGASHDPLKDKPITSMDSIKHKDIVDLLKQAKTPNQQTKQVNIGNRSCMPPVDHGRKPGRIEINLTNPFQGKLVQHLQDLAVRQSNMVSAVTNGNEQTLKELIAKGSSVNEVRSDGRTPLHYAIHSEHINIVNILLANGANVAQVTNKGNTPLHTAVSKNNKEIVDILLRHIKNSELKEFINAKTTTSGSTALHVAAAKNGSRDIVKLLLKYGAAYDVKNQKGEIPIQLSNDQHVKSLLKLIEDLYNYVKCGNSKALNILKTLNGEEFSIATNSRNNQGSTLLQIAIFHEDKTIAEKLIAILKTRNEIKTDQYPISFLKTE